MKHISLFVSGWCAAVAMLFGGVAHGALYTMTTQDDWTILESAQAGDIVEIAPGTYSFRVFLSQTGTAQQPIVIRAQDSENRPVWDLIGDEDHLVSDAAGSYTAGDLHRGCWQVASQGAHYDISGIVFRNCRDSASAGLRLINSGPVKLTGCLFENNTNGLTGASTDLVVEHCEFRQNGQVFEGGNMTHNIYLFGGNFTMRYCYNHDSYEGQLFHIRASHSRIEYNWLARPSGYVGDIMSCEYLCDGTTQHMTLLGNVIVQGTPNNQSQIIALYDDGETGVTEMNLSLYYNTLIGTPRNPGQTHTVVNMRNDSIDTHVQMYNNIFYQMGQVIDVADAGQSNWSFIGATNWVSQGTNIATMTDVIEGSDPGFLDVGNKNYLLVADGSTVGSANEALGEVALQEYYLNETIALAYRERASAEDLGAFALGTLGEGIDAFGVLPTGDLDTGSDTESIWDSDTVAGVDTNSDAKTDSDSNSSVSNDSDSGRDTETGDNSTSGDENCSCSVVGGDRSGNIWRLLSLSDVLVD